MAINPLLSLQTQGTDLSGLASGISTGIQKRAQRKEREEERKREDERFAKQNERQNRLLELKEAEFKSERDKERFANTAAAGAAILPELEAAIESGDPEAINNIAGQLERRQIDLDIQRGQQLAEGVSPEDAIDSRETSNFIQQLKQDPQAALDELRFTVDLAREKGFLDRPEDDRTSLQKNVEFLESRGIGQDEAFKMAKGGTTVNVNTGDQVPDIVEQVDNEQFKETLTDAQEVPQQRFNLEQSKKLVQRSGTGGFDQAKILMNRFGFDVPEGADLETLRSLSNQTVLPLIKKLGTRPTDRDLQTIQDIVQGVGKSTEANLAIIDIQDQILDRTEAHADIIRGLSRAGKSTSEIQQEIKKYDENNPFEIKDVGQRGFDDSRQNVSPEELSEDQLDAEIKRLQRELGGGN